MNKSNIFYHGTNKNFNEFIIPEKSSNIKSPLGLLGIYFTKCPNLASNFSKVSWLNPKSKYKKGANVIACYLDLKNPKILSIEVFCMLAGMGDKYLIEFRKNCINDGFDGIIFEKPTSIIQHSDFILEEFPTNQYVAFYNHQIKSIFK